MLPRRCSGKESASVRDVGAFPESGRSPGEGDSCFCLPGESHEQRSLEGCSPWGPKELMIECVHACAHVHTHTHTCVFSKLNHFAFPET